MDILKSLTSKFVTSVDFANTISSIIIIRLHVCCSFIGVFRMNIMMQTGALLDEFRKTHRIIFFAQKTVNMEVKPRMEVTF